MDLKDERWAVIEPLIPEEGRMAKHRRGRPWRNPRDVLNGILWILRIGAGWSDLPKRYPPYLPSTLPALGNGCHIAMAKGVGKTW